MILGLDSVSGTCAYRRISIEGKDCKDYPTSYTAGRRLLAAGANRYRGIVSHYPPERPSRDYTIYDQTVNLSSNHPSYKTIVTETYRKERVQIGAKPPKIPGPIRAIGGGERFSIGKVLKETYVTLPLA
ncbi:hypothetical protein N7497_003245 [Penicillium chrysogenum]|nr:hypothetical protein N7497_003245 [Penicillium chrysogenum]